MLRFLTAGESHGKCMTVIIEGLPSNLKLDIDKINFMLAKRQRGYGRGGRMKIETDKADILSGVRNGKTLGSPIAIRIENKDWENWKERMSPDSVDTGEKFTAVRPGHADLAGVLKYNFEDARNVLERASARETSTRTAVGSICMQLLEVFGLEIFGHVTQIGDVISSVKFDKEKYSSQIESSVLKCIDSESEKKMIEFIDKVISEGDSVGGIFEILATGVPVGLGSHVQWDRKLDARLAQALMSIQAIKGIEIGKGFETANIPGSELHDEIFYDSEKGYYHKTNNVGGIEGGISNGEDIIIRAVMKPIPTLMKPLKTIDIITKMPIKASVERSDVCAVPAACVVGESAVAYILACEMIEKFAGDSIEEMKLNYDRYINYIKNR